MASASAAKTQAATAQGEQAAAKAAAASDVSVALPSRREFLYYIWGASFALIAGEITAGVLWYAFPRFAEGEFGGTFTIDPTELPEPGAAPVSKPEGRFWLSRPVIDGQDSFVALYAVCTHLGCLPKWVDVNNRFECPCHGSKFQGNGTYIEGPAPRSMDRFRATLIFTDGTTAVTNAAGDPIPLEGRTIASIQVDTGSRIQRAGKV
ncbi:MAG TPA: ubiquinol-cytochrome c reductase iron-sulfur subunit [Spirillospora sp.]|jgi:cytochrome b6-f complex iron-sulfur subunit|nr:ubiquinol-cytochrome c reductase iron-sulfur subunit [Spirillospora sp.]